MKKQFILLCLFCLFMALLTVCAWAEELLTDDRPYTIYLGNATGAAGGEARVPVYISGKPEVAAFEIELFYDSSQLTYLRSESAHFSLIDNSVTGTSIVGAFNLTSTTITEDAPLLCIYFQMPEGLSPGDTVPISMNLETISDAEMNPSYNASHFIVQHDGVITVPPPTLSVPAIAALPGSLVELPVSVKSNSGITTGAITIDYDARLTATGVTDGLVHVTGDPDAESGGVYSFRVDENITGDGTLFALSLNVPETAQPGDVFPITVAGDGFANAAGVEFSPFAEAGSIAVIRQPVITVGGTETDPGKSIAVPVAITNPSGFTAMDVTVSYDRTKLSLVGVLEGAVPTSYKSASGAVTVTATPGSPITEDGKLFTLRFRVPPSITSEDGSPVEIPLNITINKLIGGQTDYRPLTLTNNGLITVSIPAVTPEPTETPSPESPTPSPVNSPGDPTPSPGITPVETDNAQTSSTPSVIETMTPPPEDTVDSTAPTDTATPSPVTPTNPPDPVRTEEWRAPHTGDSGNAMLWMAMFALCAVFLVPVASRARKK